MNNENKKAETTFIPCGDSMEKMDEIKDEQLEQVSGGSAVQIILADQERALPAEQLSNELVYE